uniref:Uncharacterized protein n=1 Tax=Cacopsylla melanoneura TaxID=428564 RepID=A0A8D8RHM4_9HEMI
MMKRESKSWKQVKKHIGKTLTTKNLELQKQLDSKELKQTTASTELVDETNKLNTRSRSGESDGNRNSNKNESDITNRSAQLWSKCEMNMSDIVSSVWRNKLNYKCVQAFCKYLDQNPQIKKPDYLIEMNMFSETGSEVQTKV